MARFKTFVNGGNVLPTDLDAMEDDYECAFGTYKELVRFDGLMQGGGSTGTFPLVVQWWGLNTGGSTSSAFGVYLDPARYWSAASTSTVNPRTVYYNLSAYGFTSSTGPGTVTFTIALYAVTAATTTGCTLAGSPVTGSTVTFVNPAASTILNCGYSGDFAAPTAGLYALAVTNSAALAAGSNVFFRTGLSVRQV